MVERVNSILAELFLGARIPHHSHTPAGAWTSRQNLASRNFHSKCRGTGAFGLNIGCGVIPGGKWVVGWPPRRRPVVNCPLLPPTAANRAKQANWLSGGVAKPKWPPQLLTLVSRSGGCAQNNSFWPTQVSAPKSAHQKRVFCLPKFAAGRG